MKFNIKDYGEEFFGETMKMNGVQKRKHPNLPEHRRGSGQDTKSKKSENVIKSDYVQHLEAKMCLFFKH